MEENKPTIRKPGAPAQGRLGGLNKTGTAAPPAQQPAAAPPADGGAGAGPSAPVPEKKKMLFRPNTAAAGKRPVSGRPVDSFSLGTGNTGNSGEASGGQSGLSKGTKDDDVFQKLIKKSADQKPAPGRGNTAAVRPMQVQRTRVAFDAAKETKATKRAAGAKKEPGAAKPDDAAGPGPQGRRLRKIMARTQEALRKGGVAAAEEARAAVPSQWYSDDSDAEGADHTFDYDQDYPITLPLRNPLREGAKLDIDDEFDGPDAPPIVEDFATVTEDRHDNVGGRLRLGEDMPVVEEEDWEEDEEDQAEGDDCHLLLVQLPLLPLARRTDKDQDMEDDLLPSTSHSHRLRDLPPGKVGQLLVLENGECRLRIGEHLFHVNMGAPCHSRHEIMMMNIDSRHCAYIGKVWKRAVVTPDIESLLDRSCNLGGGAGAPDDAGYMS